MNVKQYIKYLEKLKHDEKPQNNRVYLTSCPYCNASHGRQLSLFYPDDFGILSRCPQCNQLILLVCIKDSLKSISLVKIPKQ